MVKRTAGKTAKKDLSKLPIKTGRGKKQSGEPEPLQASALYKRVPTPDFNVEDFVSISQLTFAPTWVPVKKGEHIVVIPRGIRSFDAKGSTTGRATVVECQYISGDGAFITGSEKASSRVSEGDIVSVYVSAAFKADDQKGIKIVFPSGDDFLLTDLAEHMVERIVPMRLTYGGIGKTKKRRKFKQIDIQVPRDVVQEFSVSAAAAAGN